MSSLRDTCPGAADEARYSQITSLTLIKRLGKPIDTRGWGNGIIGLAEAELALGNTLAAKRLYEETERGADEVSRITATQGLTKL